MAMNWASNASAIRRASVVLPTPGGPHRIIECSRPDSKATRSGLPGPSRCCWPITSSSVLGRRRSASGAAVVGEAELERGLRHVAESVGEEGRSDSAATPARRLEARHKMRAARLPRSHRMQPSTFDAISVRAGRAVPRRCRGRRQPQVGARPARPRLARADGVRVRGRGSLRRAHSRGAARSAPGRRHARAAGDPARRGGRGQGARRCRQPASGAAGAPVAVSGSGVVSPIGNDLAAFEEALFAGRSAVRAHAHRPARASTFPRCRSRAADFDAAAVVAPSRVPLDRGDRDGARRRRRRRARGRARRRRLRPRAAGHLLGQRHGRRGDLRDDLPHRLRRAPAHAADERRHDHAERADRRARAALRRPRRRPRLRLRVRVLGGRDRRGDAGDPRRLDRRRHRRRQRVAADPGRARELAGDARARAAALPARDRGRRGSGARAGRSPPTAPASRSAKPPPRSSSRSADNARGARRMRRRGSSPAMRPTATACTSPSPTPPGRPGRCAPRSSTPVCPAAAIGYLNAHGTATTRRRRSGGRIARQRVRPRTACR